MRGFLLDTNVVSELRRPRPDEAVLAWFDHADEWTLHLSVLVAGEIRRGVERLRPADPDRAAQIDAWLETLLQRFGDRVLPVTAAVADRWGRIGTPRPLPVIDGLLAATALAYDLTLVTRDVGALAGTPVRLLDPWRA